MSLYKLSEDNPLAKLTPVQQDELVELISHCGAGMTDAQQRHPDAELNHFEELMESHGYSECQTCNWFVEDGAGNDETGEFVCDECGE